MDLTALAKPATAILALVLLAAAIVSKFVGCGLGALGLGKVEALRVGVGTVPQDIYERLIQESARRKIAGAPNQMLSALFREALTEYLDRHSAD